MLCSKCKEDKKEDRFEYRKDRNCFRTVCKDCKNIRARKNYIKISENLSEKRKLLRNENKEEFNRKARFRYWKNREDLLKKAKERDSYKNRKSEVTNKWRMRNKEKAACHQQVVRALKKGKIKKPETCLMCGKNDKLHAHHSDYKKPLEVVWVCPSCHRKIHSKFFKNDL